MKNENTRTIHEQSNSNSKPERFKNPVLKLNDRSIKTISTDFMRPQQVDRVSYIILGCKGMSCQGLRLVHYRISGRKSLVLDYWIGGKGKKFVLPDYNPDTFNVRHIEKRISELRTKYGNKHNLTWDLDINHGEKAEKISRFKAQMNQSSSKSIKEVIEEFYKAGFPKIRNDGTSPNRNTIRGLGLYLIGSSVSGSVGNDRSKSFTLTEDEARNGVMILKPKFNNWDSVFARYPSQFNPAANEGKEIKFHRNISIYDGPLSIYNISELTTELVMKYLSITDKASLKIELKLTLSYIWNFAKNRGWIPGTPINPFTEVKISKPTKTHMTEWNKKEYTQDELHLMFEECNKLKAKYPGQPELFQLEMLTGRRGETLQNLKWSDIKFEEKVESYTDDSGSTKVIKFHGVITVPPWSNKTDDEDKLPITNTIKSVLESLIKVRDSQEPWRRFIDWVFVSPRVKQKNYLRLDKPNNSAEARLKDPRECWLELLDNCGLRGKAMRKMFRTTYQNKVDRLKNVNSSWDAITVTGQNDTRAHERNYMNKKLTPKVVSHFQQIDEEFSDTFKTRKNN